MLIPPPTRATVHASRRTALQGDVASARAQFGAGLAALILALLVRLLGRTEAAWIVSLENMDDHPPTPHVPHPHTIIMPAIGRAPHAACIEAGLVPDWILPGIRNRGMHPAALPPRPRRRPRPARAPPAACPAPR